MGDTRKLDRETRARVAALAVIAASLVAVAPGAAVAKGPPELRRAEIDGPGLHRPTVFTVRRQRDNLALLLSQAGVLGDGSAHPAQQPPSDDLGSRYTITYLFRSYGPLPRSEYWGSRRGHVRQQLYPYARGGPLIFTPGGQRLPRTPGHPTSVAAGWSRGSDVLFDNLTMGWGLPRRPPVGAKAVPEQTPSNGRAWALGAAGLGGGGALLLWAARRARRNQGS